VGEVYERWRRGDFNVLEVRAGPEPGVFEYRLHKHGDPKAYVMWVRMPVKPENVLREWAEE